MTPSMRRARLLGPALLAAFAAGCADAPPPTAAGSDAGVGATLPEAPAPAATPLARTIYGLDDQNTLVAFDGDRPGQLSRRVAVTGVTGLLVGLDFRPNDSNLADGDQTGLLYAVSGTGAIYTVDPTTGAATLRSQITVALTGGLGVGVGFNPMADRLRIHTDAEQDLRINVETGATIVDGTLAYAAGDVNAGRTPDVVASAYTNSVSPAPAATELYAIDAAQDVLVELNAPNNGQLSTVGRLVIDNGALVGFDIPGRATDRKGFATFTPPRGTRSFLYRINLDNAAREPVGPVGHDRPIISIAIDDRDGATAPLGNSFVQDPQGDFVTGYVGPRAGDVDVLSTETVYNGTSFVLTANLAGPLGTTPGALYVWGFNRGAGTARFGALATGVLFDVAVVARADGTGNVGATALAPGSVVVTGNQLRVTVPAGLLPPQGSSPAQYTVNLWPRVGAGNNNQISDFAPDNSNSPVRSTVP